MHKIIIALLFVAYINGVSAQSNLTLYNMEPVPQRLQVNPALAPDCKWFFGTPAASSLDFNFNSNVLSLKQISNGFVPNGPDNYALNLDSIKNFIDKQTYVGLGINQEWFTLGFRIRKSMFTLGVNEKIKTRIALPNDIFKLAFQGNGGQNLGYDFNFNFGLDILHTREYSLGFNRKFLGHRLSLGGRLKYIRGINVINTVKNDLVFNTDPETFAYTATADIEVNASTPFTSSTIQATPLETVFGNKDNSGFGLDLGARLEITDKLSVSASVIDLGVLNWNTYTTNIKSKRPGGSFVYRGEDLNNYLGDTVSGGAGIENIVDTLVDIFALERTSKSFSTGLLGEFYLGANIHLTERHNAGALIYGSFYNKQFYPAMTVSWNSELGRILAISASYTIMRNNFTNVGAGLALNMGPEQIYFVSDNVLGAYTGDVRNLTFRFGWNHTVGRKAMERKDDKLDEKRKNRKKNIRKDL